MTNTYPENATPHEKIAEELRLIRCVLERRLMADNPQEYADYQQEKFKVLEKLGKLAEEK